MKRALIVFGSKMEAQSVYDADELEEVACGQRIEYDDETQTSGKVVGGFWFVIVPCRTCRL